MARKNTVLRSRVQKITKILESLVDSAALLDKIVSLYEQKLGEETPNVAAYTKVMKKFKFSDGVTFRAVTLKPFGVVVEIEGILISGVLKIDRKGLGKIRAELTKYAGQRVPEDMGDMSKAEIERWIVKNRRNLDKYIFSIFTDKPEKLDENKERMAWVLSDPYLRQLVVEGEPLKI